MLYTFVINISNLFLLIELHILKFPALFKITFYNRRANNSNLKTDESTELLHVRRLEGVHLAFNLEAGSLLPLAVRGRVRHGRHFTFKSMLDDTAITLVAASVTGTLVNHERPYAAQGAWLQVLIPDDLAQDMANTFAALAAPETLLLPKTFVWPEQKLTITIVADKI